MNTQKIMNNLLDIFKDVLDEDDIELTAQSTADDLDEWDSLTHIQLIVAIEKHFAIKFTTSEIHGFKNVGDMCNLILEKNH